jgi:hypothetical protein
MGYESDVEVIKRFAIILSFPQDGFPAKAGLGPLQDQEFEQGAIMVLRHSPFTVVIGNG